MNDQETIEQNKQLLKLGFSTEQDIYLRQPDGRYKLNKKLKYLTDKLEFKKPDYLMSVELKAEDVVSTDITTVSDDFVMRNTLYLKVQTKVNKNKSIDVYRELVLPEVDIKNIDDTKMKNVHFNNESIDSIVFDLDVKLKDGSVQTIHPENMRLRVHPNLECEISTEGKETSMLYKYNIYPEPGYHIVMKLIPKSTL